MQRGETRLKVGSERFASFRDAEEIGEFLRGGENLVDVLRAGGVGGDAESVECAKSVETIDFLGDENQVGMEGGDFLEIRIDGAADFPFLLRVGRVVAIVGVADEAVLHTEGVKRFGQAGRKRDDARGKLRDADGAAELVNNFVHGGWRGGWRGGRERLGAEGQAGKQKQGDGDNAGATYGVGKTVLHESPLAKVPRET